MARGISDYPASFAPVLTKHGISFKDTLNIDRDVKTPLWQYVATSSEPDFAKAFFEKLDKEETAGALSLAIQQVCAPKGQSVDTVNSHSREKSLARVAALRKLGYSPLVKVAVQEADGKTVEVSGPELLKSRKCSKTVEEMVAKAKNP